MSLVLFSYLIYSNTDAARCEHLIEALTVLETARCACLCMGCVGASIMQLSELSGFAQESWKDCCRFFGRGKEHSFEDCLLGQPCRCRRTATCHCVRGSMWRWQGNRDLRDTVYASVQRFRRISASCTMYGAGLERGKIPSKHSFLIACRSSTSPTTSTWAADRFIDR